MEKNRLPLIRRPEDWAMIVSFSVSAFILINVSFLLGRIRDEGDYVDFYPSSFSAWIEFDQSVQKADERDAKEIKACGELFDYLCGITKGNASIVLSASINGMIKTEQVCLVASMNEEAPFLEGCLKDDEELKKNGVYIGESMEKYLFKKEGGEYINIGGIDMPYAGTVKNHMSSGEDSSIYIILDRCDNAVRDSLKKLMPDNWNINIYLQGSEDLLATWNGAVEKIGSLGYKVNQMPGESYEGSKVDDFYKNLNMLVQSVVAVFSLFSCFMAAAFWSAGIRRETAIRRAFGWDMGQIFLYLSKCVGKFACISFLIAAVFELVFYIAGGELPSRWPESLIAALLMQLGVSLLVLSGMMGKIKKTSMSELLREE